MDKLGRKNTAVGISIISVLIPVILYGGAVKGRETAPLVVQAKAIEIPAPTPQLVYPEPEDTVEGYIRKVFGQHTDKALLLLRGNKKCAENRTLDPKAVNDNTQWGGVGRDCGVFQINDVYHPFTCEQLKNYKTNIDYAYRMFKNDDYTFRRWTAGRCLGI